MSFELQENVPLSGYSTIGLGGKARYWALCRSIDEIRQAIVFARTNNLAVHILGGGSNTLFADAGFGGLVLKVDLRGIVHHNEGGWGFITAAAGESWDALVTGCVQRGLAGVECLAGIPGSVGATPIQNVGAYGQEVADTIVSVTALGRNTLEPVTFQAKECRFAYRQSRFKGDDSNKYIITQVVFRMLCDGAPSIRYPELRRHIESTTDLNALGTGRAALEAVRSTVIALRKKKSMVIDPSDPQSKSLGSFFTNPVVTEAHYRTLKEQWSDMPSFTAEGGVKIPAAWLVEHAGFRRGFKQDGAAISANHALALVNLGTTTGAILGLATRIQEEVQRLFGIALQMEPVVVPFQHDNETSAQAPGAVPQP